MDLGNLLTTLEAAYYVSVWDDGVAITTNCLYDRKNNVVSEIDTVDADGLDLLIDEDGLDLLIDEYVLLSDGTQIRDFSYGEYY
jgi:hypothetical protein